MVAADGPGAHEIELAVAGGGKARGKLTVGLEQPLELFFADRADDGLGNGLRRGGVLGQMTKTDDVAREGELDDLVLPVIKTQVVAKRAALDAEQLTAAITGVEKRFAPRQPAHAAGADAANGSGVRSRTPLG